MSDEPADTSEGALLTDAMYAETSPPQSPTNDHGDDAEADGGAGHDEHQEADAGAAAAAVDRDDEDDAPHSARSDADAQQHTSAGSDDAGAETARSEDPNAQPVDPAVFLQQQADLAIQYEREDEQQRVADEAAVAAAERMMAEEADAFLGAGDASARFEDDEYGEPLFISRQNIVDAQAELAVLKAKNKELERRAWAYIHANRSAFKAQSDERLSHEPAQLRQQYDKTFEQVTLLWKKIDEKRHEADAQKAALNETLQAQLRRAMEIEKSFKTYKREITLLAKDRLTGRPIKLKRLRAHEDEEVAKDREVSDLRLVYIQLQHQYKRLDEELKHSDELAEGLHVTDFEQLKIENQTLNEKIEERNDELHKLRKKTTTTVQILTHIKEKLQFVQRESLVLRERLGQLNDELKTLRDAVTHGKQNKLALRAEQAALKEQEGFVGSDHLVQDFESRKLELGRLGMQAQRLAARHASLSRVIAKANALKAERAREQQRQQQAYYKSLVAAVTYPSQQLSRGRS